MTTTKMKRWVPAVALGVGLAASVHGCDGGGSRGGSTAAGASAAAPTSSQTATPAGPQAPAARPRSATVVARHGEGFLEVHHGGRKVVHTKGTSYERGVQYGVLVGDEVEGVFNKLTQYVAAQGVGLAASLQTLLTPIGAAVMRPYFDADALAELRGIVDGMRLRNPGTFVTEADLIFINSIIDLGAVVNLDVFRCSGLAVWGSIAKDGKLFQTRCVDLMIGSGIEDHALVVIAKPEGGVPYLNPGWAGMIGAASGLNARGVGVSQVWAFSIDKGFGRPWILATRELLATGSSVDDAVRIFSSHRRTYGSNFVFADRGDTRGGQPRGISIESSQRDLRIFESNDPAEDLALWNGQPYAIKIPEAVFRGDAYLDPTMRARQTGSAGPTGDPRPTGAYRNRYQGQADGIMRFVNAGVKIGADECIQITKDVAMRRNSLQCVVYANTDLEVWVANSRIGPNGQLFDAWDEPYLHYSLDDYAPVARAVPDRTTFARGETVQVAVPITTLGRGHGLDVHVALDLGGVTTVLGSATALTLPDRGAVTAIVDVTIPAGLGNVGLGALHVEVMETGTTAIVDVARTPVTVTP
ncbi:MAG: hypothetical protein KF878_29700 [Planctomycetes bacterium]|nr:hypothetical protein [Planctomycetota bacterium]